MGQSTAAEQKHTPLKRPSPPPLYPSSHPTLLDSRQVYKELAADTPRDLLTREMWGTSSGAAEWLHVQHGYIQSMAVTCIVGHIVGLGDRHLDNLLLDVSTGELVHIDYNVCFDKGRQLRVPERVPYRLTPIFQYALGVAGVEGGFRRRCEQVLDILCNARELLLTLMEAFVHDPLVRQHGEG